MKQILSVSLGTSKRDLVEEIEFLGEKMRVERRGTDGDMKKFADTFYENDGKVDALGVGGADIYLRLGDTRYTFKEIGNIVKKVTKTPVVDGSGLKHTLERETIRTLARTGQVDFKGKKALMVSAVDRFGMAQALEEAGCEVTYGDLMFGIGINVPLKPYTQVQKFGKLILPVITQLPFKWFYPTGKQQEERKPKYPKAFEPVDIVAGDWHYIRRYMPDRFPGRTIITQTIRSADLELLKGAGVSKVITTTPDVNGQTFATNVMEAAIVAHLGQKPETLTPEDYLRVLAELGWKPNIYNLDATMPATPSVP